MRRLAARDILLQAVRYGRWPLILAVVFGAVIGLNALAGYRPVRWDLTAEKRFTLSDQTAKVLRSLDRPVKLVAVIHRNTDAGDLLENLVREYRRRSGRISFQIVDFARSQNVARSYGVETPNTIVVESGGKRRQVEGFNLFSTTMDGVEFKGEQALTRAILEVTGRAGRKVYFLEGHGEPALDGELARLRSLVEGEGHTVASLNLAVRGSVPADAAVVVILGPEQDLDARETQALVDYRRKGGRLFLLVDPLPGRPLPELGRLAEDVGVRIADDLAVDPVRGFFGDATAPVPEPLFHPITDPLLQKRLNVVLPGSRSLVDLKKNGLGVTVLLQTSAEAWGERNPMSSPIRRDTGETVGPLALAAAVTAQDKPAAVVVGNSTFVRGNALTVRGNVDFFLNSLGWLIGQEELISIRPKELSAPRAEITGPEATRIFYGTTLAMPLAVVAVGGYVWHRRRRL